MLVQIQVQQKAEEAEQQDPAAPRFQGFVYSFNTTSGRGAVRSALNMGCSDSRCLQGHQLY